MALREIKQPVEVQARTIDGKPVPMQVMWNRKYYSVAKVDRSRTRKIKKRRIEEITLTVFTWPQMILEYDYQTRAWQLLAVEEL